MGSITDKCVALRQEGKSLRAIGAELGISKNTVSRHLETVNKSWLNPKWVQVQGADQGPVDVYGGVPAPDAETLLKLNEDTVYTCVDWCAKSVAETPLKVLVKTYPGQAQPKCLTAPLVTKSIKASNPNIREVLEHPLVELLEYPNAQQSKYDFWYYIDTQLSLVGNAYVFIRREEYERQSNQLYVNEGLPVALWPLLTQHVEQQAERGQVVGYAYNLTNPPEFYNKKDILHFKFISHMNPYAEGYSPVRAAYERILIGKNEQAYILSLFRNQGQPNVGVGIKGGVTEDQIERMQKEWSMRYSKGGSGGPWVFNAEEYDITTLNWKPKDLLGTELYKWTKLQIINEFSLNPALFDQESSNRAVATQAKIQAQEKAIRPRQRLTQERLNHQLAPEFDERLVVEWDNPVQEDEDFDLEKRKTYLAAGVYTINEVRKMEGLPPVQGGDAPAITPQKVNDERLNNT